MTDSLVCIFITFIIIFTIYIHFENKYYNATYVKSSVDKRTYLVRNVDNKKIAADILAEINLKLLELIDYLDEIKGDNEKIKRLKNNYDPNNISESLENSKYTSYSVNKGEKIVFCIRSKDKKQSIENFNILMFVAIHELAHIMTMSIGHTTEFWGNFKFLLKHAVKLGIYYKNDFKKNPRDYCGIKITDSPLN